jgi:hypothetical protein
MSPGLWKLLRISFLGMADHLAQSGSEINCPSYRLPLGKNWGRQKFFQIVCNGGPDFTKLLVGHH